MNYMFIKPYRKRGGKERGWKGVGKCREEERKEDERVRRTRAAHVGCPLIRNKE